MHKPVAETWLEMTDIFTKIFMETKDKILKIETPDNITVWIQNIHSKIWKHKLK